MEESNKPKPITIYDIAKEAGISVATVSRAISGKGYVSEKSKKIVSQLVEKYDFRPNTFAQNLQSGYTKTIGFIVPHIGNMYFANVYYEFEKWASSQGYMTILLNSKGVYDIESRLLISLKEKHVDGIVLMGGRVDAIDLDERYIKEIVDIHKSVPIVACSSEAARFGCDGISSNDEKGVEELLRFLKEQGYQRICLTGGGDEYYPSYIKKKSALEIGKKLGLDVQVRWLLGNEVFSYRAGYESMKILLSEENPPEVVCGINDYVAIGAINAAMELGLKVPEDIAVTGFDDVSITTMTQVHLTSVNPHYEEFGKKVFTILNKRIQNKSDSPIKTTMIRPELIVRHSTK